ncbi:hypothetical protein ACFQVD_03360 [Streptosporangium amethystogenes subsp. fukuiense]|uniref:Uncharacterized protein n=1 Tax=Streptosporangium amethystogenes subsp. fukuiense TaxID=698418 RepID=A0ABW2SUL5_9ACTN
MRTYSKAVHAAVVAASAAALAVVSPAPAASAAAVTIRVVPAYSETQEESSSWFVCPTNQVLTGRSHRGDENADTTYTCSWIFINDEQVQVSIGDWSLEYRENNSNYSSPPNQALVGRRHILDENGWTRYRSASLAWRGQTVRLIDPLWTGDLKESNHNYQTGTQRVLIGRAHSGDENGNTRYQHAYVTIDA